jgi:magnesium transporter
MTNRNSRNVAKTSRPFSNITPSKGFADVLEEAEEEDSYMDDYFYDEPGAMPGTLNIEEDASPSRIVLIDYNDANATRLQLPTPEACAPYLDTESVSWVDVQGLGSEDVLRSLGHVFRLHPLVLEDMVNVPQRPKVEEYDDQLLIVTRMVTPHEDGDGFYSEQVSFILGKHYLLTVQEEPEIDTFRPVRDRIRTGAGSIRKHGPDYLTYALLDTIVDGFFPVLEAYGERIEDLEDEVIFDPSRKTVEKIYSIKRELLALRRAIWPQREAINALIRDGNRLVSADVQIYLRDCYDHATQVMDMVETYRELTSSMMDVYLSAVSNRMNEVMKVLTVISTIFIPLTFIAGVYGMNFDPGSSPWNMPELKWYWGYPACLLSMGAIALALVLFFLKRGWFADFSGVTIKND